MENVNPETDRNLFCGYLVIDGTKYLWRYHYKSKAQTAFLIVSPFVLTGIILALWQNLLPTVGWTIAAILTGLVAAVGSIVDVIIIGFEVKFQYETSNLKVPDGVVNIFEKASALLFETASPVFIAWLLAGYHAGELIKYSNEVRFIFALGFIVGACGCVYDAYLMFGPTLSETWRNRKTNFLGATARNIVRAIGFTAIKLDRCPYKKNKKTAS